MMTPMMRTLGLLACTAAVAVSAQRARPESAMADAAQAFLKTLDSAQAAKAKIPFNSEERLNWHFVPKTGERKGLVLKEMNADQRQAAAALLRASLSEQGYHKAATIRELEKVLHVMENRNPIRDPELYYFSVFGDPGEASTWGWRYEGHHCSLNWTLVKGKTIASSPQFFGTNPGEVRVDVPGAPPKGTRVLGREEDLGRALVKALGDEQKKDGVISNTAPNDILTGASRQAAIQEDKGIAYRNLTKDQQGMLLSLIQEYTDSQPRMLARQRIAAIRKAGLDSVKFAWMGGLERGEPHYYRIQGPTFLVEYDNTQNNANHVHAVWRDFKGDFGMDLLAMHYQASPHKVARAK